MPASAADDDNFIIEYGLAARPKTCQLKHTGSRLLELMTNLNVI
jgi:hypothetical protein